MDSRVSWSDLPRDLLAEIVKGLETRTDVQSFREVCWSWYFSCPRSSKLLSLIFPLTIKPPSIDPLGTSRERVVITASNIYVLLPRQGEALADLSTPWLVRLEEVNHGFLKVRNPLVENWNIQFPKDFPMCINLARIEVIEVFKGFNLRKESPGLYQIGMSNLKVHKVVACSDSHGKFPATVHDFTAVVLFLVGRLYAVRLRDNHWKYIKFGHVSRFDDVLNFRGEILVLDRKGRLYQLCCTTFSYVCIVSHPPPCHALAKTRKHLVELCGEVYLVNFVGYYFRVYKMNREARLWTEVHSLGEDRILFVGPDCSFSALAENFPGCSGNTIIYHVDSFRPHRRETHAFFTTYDNPNWYLFFAAYRFGGSVDEDIFSLTNHSDVVWPPPAWLSHPDHYPRTAKTLKEISPEEAPETDAVMVDGQGTQDSIAPT